MLIVFLRVLCINLRIKNVICLFENRNKSLESSVNFLIRVAKFYFHKCFLRKFILLRCTVKYFIKSLKL